MLDRNLKQRLIGAAVLISVGIVIIPLLLGEPAEMLSEHKNYEVGKNTLSELEKSTLISTKTLPAQGGEKPPIFIPMRKEESSASSKMAGWFIQVGSFSHRGNALRVHHNVTSSGYRAFIGTVEKGARTIYKVRVGPEKDGIHAKKVKKELERRLQTRTFIISPSDG